MNATQLSSVELGLLKLHHPSYVHRFKDPIRRQIQDRLLNLGMLFRVGDGCYGITDTGINSLIDARKL